MNPQMMGGSEQVPPEILEALMGQMGAGAPPEAAAAEPTWADAINTVHQLMVTEQDPQLVSLLGAVLNQLTTGQAKKSGG